MLLQPRKLKRGDLNTTKSKELILGSQKENNTQYTRKNHLSESILRTCGAVGMFMNREVEKNDMRLRASKLVGTSIALSLTVSSKRRRLICYETVWSLTCGMFTSNCFVCISFFVCLCPYVNSSTYTYVHEQLGSFACIYVTMT